MGKANLIKENVVEIIKNFVEDKAGEWDWDDFISIPIEDESLDGIRERCAGLPEEYPSPNENEYCNDEGVEVLKEIIKKLED